MYHNIKVNVVGPMKSGKSKIVKIIEEATAGMGVVVTEQNDLAQAPPAQDNQKAQEAPAGGCLPRPCSAPVLKRQIIGEEYIFTHEVRVSENGNYLEKYSSEPNQSLSDLPQEREIQTQYPD